MPTIAIVRYTSPGEDGATFMGYLASLRSPNHNPDQYSLWSVRKAIEPQFKLAAKVNEHGSWPPVRIAGSASRRSTHGEAVNPSVIRSMRTLPYRRCPHYPRKRTWEASLVLSALGQLTTWTI